MPLTKVTGGEIDGTSSINVTGIVTATTFNGNIIGVAAALWTPEVIAAYQAHVAAQTPT